MILSPAQRAAVERTGQDVCVVAGPGSGKTRVLVERYAWLVRQQKKKPSRLLAITFTEKAANEIKERLAREFGEDAELRRQLERAPISTIHSFAKRLLGEHAVAAGLDPRFAMLDEDDAQRIEGEAIAAVLNRWAAQRENELLALMSAWAGSDAPADLRAAMEAIRTGGLPRERWLVEPDPYLTFTAFREAAADLLSLRHHATTEKQKQCFADLEAWLAREGGEWTLLAEFQFNLQPFGKKKEVSEPARAVREQFREVVMAAMVARHYQPLRQSLCELLDECLKEARARRRAVPALDFPDLEEEAIRLLAANGRLREEIRESFDEILIDELQDTNPRQWELLNLIRKPGGFYAVGDVNQSIYGFRLADPQGFRDYRAGLAGTVDELRANYRSRAEVLGAVERVLGDRPGLEKPRHEAERRFHHVDPRCVEVYRTPGEEKDFRERREARFIARRIRELAGGAMVEDRDGTVRAARFSDIAVLMRTMGALAVYEEAFAEFGIPYALNKGQGFYERQEVRDSINWLRAVADSRNDMALVAVLRSPLAGISDSGLLRLKDGGVPLCDTLEPERLTEPDASRLRRALALLGKQRVRRRPATAGRLLAEAYDATGYEQGQPAEVRANLDKLLGMVRGLAPGAASLEELIDLLESRRAGREPNAKVAETTDAVQVLTMHGAKGLEFPIVVLPALHKGTGNDTQALRIAGDSGLGAKWWNPGDPAKTVEDTSFRAAAAATNAREKMEADRLLYVAMTRAEQRLILSWGEGRNKTPWPELIEAGLDAVEVSEDAAIEDLPPVAIPVIEPEEIPPANPAGQHDAAAAVTILGKFARCPRRFWLDELELAPEDPEPDAPLPSRGGTDELTAAEFGTQVHDLLANLPVEKPAAEALRLADVFRDSLLGRRLAKATRVEREFDFLYEESGLMLRGRIDLWFEDAEGRWLVDYKTDNIAAEEAHERAREYELQMLIYAGALERLDGKRPDRALLTFLRPQTEVGVEIRSAEPLRRVIAEFQKAQETVEFPMVEGAQCGRCPHRGGSCPTGGSVSAPPSSSAPLP